MRVFLNREFVWKRARMLILPMKLCPCKIHFESHQNITIQCKSPCSRFFKFHTPCYDFFLTGLSPGRKAWSCQRSCVRRWTKPPSSWGGWLSWDKVGFWPCLIYILYFYITRFIWVYGSKYQVYICLLGFIWVSVYSTSIYEQCSEPFCYFHEILVG